MGSQKISKSRRALLNKTLGLSVLGVAMPSSWTKPIVNSVVLPAHAQMSIGAFTVTKTQVGDPSPATLVGDVINYEIVVANTGDIDLTGVVATDTLPDGTVIVLDSPSESMTADGVLEVGESWTYSTSYTVTADDLLAGDNLVNSVSVVTNEVPDPQTDDEETPVEPVECPTIVVGAVTQSVGTSGGLCSLSFEFFSSTTTPLTITSITNTALTATSEVTYDDTPPVDVTDSIGTSVTWTGGLTDVNCAAGFTLIADDVTFTVEATCEGGVESVTVDFLLSDIATFL